MEAFYTFLGFIFLTVFVLGKAVKITREYERGVVFRLGRFVGVRGPGLFLLIPLIENMERVDLRVITLDVPKQDVITSDNIPVNVDAVVYFQISDPARSVIAVEDFLRATSQISQTSLRSVTGKSTLDDILTQRERINHELHQIIDEATNPWGIKVSAVEVKHVEIPQDMQRQIARQAEAERIRRAKVIIAEGEFQAAQKLKEAADVLDARPIMLRYLETVVEAAKEKNTTILFPMEIINALQKPAPKE